MESVGLEKVLKELAEEPFFPLDFEAWAKDLVPNLPKEPIDAAWLTKLVEPYPAIGQATMLEHLSRLGRLEIAPVALACAEKAKGFAKLCLAGILIRCRVDRGYEIVEELYRYGLEHPDDKENAVATGHVFDTLTNLGRFDRKAVLLRVKLVELSNERRNKKA